MKTRTIRYLPKGGAEVVEIDVPEPGPGQVQVKTGACGVCMWDIATFKTGSEARWAAPPGHEGVGRVVRLGPGVKGVAEGDRVVSGGFAGLINSNAGKLYRIPADSTLPDEHWIVEPVSCVVTGLDRAEVRAGDRVALIGCGFMGLLLMQGLSRCPAEQVFAIDVDNDRLALAGMFGAAGTFNPTSAGFDEAVQRLSKIGIDTVIDATGAQAGLDLATRLVRASGRILLFGWLHGKAGFDGDAWHMGGFTIINATPSAALRDTFPPAIRLLHRRVLDLEPLVTHVTDIEGLPKLLATAADKKDNYIKGVVKWD